MRYKANILDLLTKAGYNTYVLRRDKILGQSTIKALRYNKSISLDTAIKIAKLLGATVDELFEEE